MGIGTRGKTLGTKKETTNLNLIPPYPKAPLTPQTNIFYEEMIFTNPEPPWRGSALGVLERGSDTQPGAQKAATGPWFWRQRRLAAAVEIKGRQQRTAAGGGLPGGGGKTFL